MSEGTTTQKAAPAPKIGGDAPPERVLSTLNKDGTRRWLHPKLSTGRFWARRRVVAYGLIALFTALPWLTINGKPAVLLDLPAREFTILGATFLPTDTLLLMLFMGAVFVTIFLLTALLGRVWCGWGCPQTVYMEYVYRPIERLFERGQKQKGPPQGARRAGMYAVYLVVSLALAHVFLSYFVGVERLFDWMQQSPLEHPKAFLIVAAVTAAMMFDFAFFREQTCLVACPYGRFQSVMLDRFSLIVTYDERRGEPRGKKRRKRAAPAPADVHLPVAPGAPVAPGVPAGGAAATPASEPVIGDCVDCGLCTKVCPTGIDIRDGLQMECIGCAQCIDACDEVMDKLGRDRGLIRYSSEDAVETGRTRIFRPRVILYPALLLVFVSLFVTVLVTKAPADVTFLRAIDVPYVTLPSGEIENSFRVKIVNRSDETRRYTIVVGGLEGARVVTDGATVEVEGRETVTADARVIAPATAFSLGRAGIDLTVADDLDFSTSERLRLQGPWNAGGAEPAPADDEDRADGATGGTS